MSVLGREAGENDHPVAEKDYMRCPSGRVVMNQTVHKLMGHNSAHLCAILNRYTVHVVWMMYDSPDLQAISQAALLVSVAFLQSLFVTAYKKVEEP